MWNGISCKFHTLKTKAIDVSKSSLYLPTNCSVSLSCLTILPAWPEFVNLTYHMFWIESDLLWEFNIVAFTCIHHSVKLEQPNFKTTVTCKKSIHLLGIFFPYLSVEKKRKTPVGWKRIPFEMPLLGHMMQSFRFRPTHWSPDILRSRRMTPWVSFNIKQWHGEGVRQTGSFCRFFDDVVVMFESFLRCFLGF